MAAIYQNPVVYPGYTQGSPQPHNPRIQPLVQTLAPPSYYSSAPLPPQTMDILRAQGLSVPTQPGSPAVYQQPPTGGQKKLKGGPAKIRPKPLAEPADSSPSKSKSHKFHTNPPTPPMSVRIRKSRPNLYGSVQTPLDPLFESPMPLDPPPEPPRPRGPPSPPRTETLDILKRTLQTPLAPSNPGFVDPKSTLPPHKDPANKPLEYLKDAIFNEDLYGARRLLDAGTDIRPIVGNWEEIISKGSVWLHHFLWTVGYTEFLGLSSFEAALKALQVNRPAILDILLKHHPRADGDLETLVRWAVHLGTFRCLDVLLERPFQPNFLEGVFIEAIERGSFQSVRIFLDRKLIPNLEAGLMASLNKLLSNENIEAQTTIIRSFVFHGASCQGNKALHGLLQSHKDRYPILKKIPF